MNADIEIEQYSQVMIDVQHILEHWHEQTALWSKSHLAVGVDRWGNDWEDVTDYPHH